MTSLTEVKRVPVNSLEFSEFHLYMDKEVCFIKSFLEGNKCPEKDFILFLSNTLEKLEDWQLLGRLERLHRAKEKQDLQLFYDYLCDATTCGNLGDNAVSLLCETISSLPWYNRKLDKDEILRVLQEESDSLFLSLGLFGSFNNGEPTNYSDVDVLVYSYDTESDFDCGGLQERLSLRLGRIVNPAAILTMRKDVLEEVVTYVIGVHPKAV